MSFRVYLEVTKKTLEDEIRALESLGSEYPEASSFTMGAKQALIWLLQGKESPSELLVENGISEHIH